MLITSVKTPIITAGSIELLALLDKVLPAIEDGSVLAITSKVVSLCENNIVPIGSISKQELIAQESDLHLPAIVSKYGHHFTIVNNTLVGVGGIDESNGDGNYVLWPKNAQATANKVRQYLKQRFSLTKVGVIVTDSTSHPLRRGTIGIMLAFSGFRALNNYIGSPDLFGRPYEVSLADVSGGLAAAAVLQMGEGAEQTPLAIISDAPFVEFQDHDPTEQELAGVIMSFENDLFAPFFQHLPWIRGKRKHKQ